MRIGEHLSMPPGRLGMPVLCLASHFHNTPLMQVRRPEATCCWARQAFEDGMSEEQLHEYTKIDPWFLAQLGQLHQADAWLKTQSLDRLSAADLLQVKRRGFSDPQIAKAVGAGPFRPYHSCGI